MVIVHPDYAILILEINELREEIADLIVEKEMLTHYVCKELEIDYTLKIGTLEYKLAVAENRLDKSLRKLELIEEKLEKNLEVNIESIDKKINNEFKKQNKEEQNMLSDIDFAIEMTAIELVDYDIIDEMNVDYFKLQKMYNPILDLEISDEKDKLYKKIEKYYQKGNYKKLHKLAENYDEENILQDEISNLKKLKDKYIDIINQNKKEIRKIKNSFPYNQKVILEDENLYRRKKDNLNKEIMEINIEDKKVQRKIDNKLKNL